jgi:drug/metabolite transporter (DMT)-like permease
VTGELLALFSAFAFACGTVAIGTAGSSGKEQGGVLLSVLLTGALSLAGWAALGSGSMSRISSSPTALAWFAASGILATVWGRLTLYKAIHDAGVIRASTVRRLTPFFSVFFAWLILGETVGVGTGWGMALIAASFLLLIADNRRKLDKTPDWPAAPANIPRGYMFGVLCGLSYALSYIARKFGLTELPDAFLGALIGSLAALSYYAVGCVFSAAFRRVAAEALRRPEPWQLAAAAFISVGQISQFMALNYTGVSQLALINSAEIYIAAYLAVFVFRMERMPSAAVLIATVLATAGVALTALG